MFKKVALIIAFRDFQDEEYSITRQILENGGIKVMTFSTSLGKAIGVYGEEVEVDYLIDELKMENFDALAFIGGAGVQKYAGNPKIEEIILSVIKKNEILAAICIAPIILAKAGALKGKKATVWNSQMDRSPIKILKENGAVFEDKDVIIDGNIITANGPEAARKFGEALTRLLQDI